jgi:hypothetical protein
MTAGTTKSAQSGGRLKRAWPVGLGIGLALIVGVIATMLPLKLLIVTLALPLLGVYFAVAILRFDHAVLLLIFFAPLLPTSVGMELSPSLPLITIQRVMLACLYAILLLRLGSQGFIMRLPRLSSMVWLAAAFYFGASVLSSLFTTIPLKSLYRVLANLFDSVGLFALVAFTAIRYRERAFARTALLILWISFTALALMGLVDTLTGFSPLYYLPAARQEVFRPVYRLGILRGQGLLPNATAMGMVAAMGAILTLLVIAWNKRPSRQWGLWLLLLFHVAALAGTITRTGWIAFALGCIIWVVMARGVRIQLVLVGLGILGFLMAIGAGAVIYAVIVAGFDISSQKESATLLSRLTWANLVWVNITADKARLLLGYGPGTVENLQRLWSYPGFQANLTTDYVIKLAEGGLVGVFTFLWLLLASVVQCRIPIRSGVTWIRYAGILLLIAFLQIALGSVTLPLFVWAQTTYVFWILLSILADLAYETKLKSKNKLAIQAAAEAEPI